MASTITLPSLLQLNQWQQNFLQLNAGRIAAARELMVPRAQQVLDVLPLLLHLNHPRLPGFVNFKVPTGIQNYQPNKIQLAALRRIARGLQVDRMGGQLPLLGMYLIGSIGSVTQARSSDLDVWLCYRENLDHDELKALAKKCELIEEWAAEQGVELHFFRMNLTHFREGKIGSTEGESSGSSQHLLLLDEFYRSSVWLAGCQPRWWLIPNEDEQHAEKYWELLVERGLVQDQDWLQFGAVAIIPAEEFIGSGLWQLHKGLSDPYKSILKLQLTCNYAHQFPKSRPLCWDLKAQVHQGNYDHLANDTYLLLLERITTQFKQENNHKRVDLARRAFYYKAGLPLTQLANVQRKVWRTQVLLDLAKEWQWDDDILQRLDERPNWQPERIAEERNLLVNEMLLNYQFLLEFSQQFVSKLHISRQDMLILGNRLYAAFDSRPGKIVNINPGISQSLTQETIRLDYQQGLWRLIPKHARTAGKPLRQTPSLVELLCFARYNNIIEGHTRIAISQQQTALTVYELRQLQGVVQSLPMLQPNSQTFLQPAKPVRWCLVVNAATDPQQRLTNKGMQKLSNRDDALGFSSTRENLVHCIDLISVNSWGEWQVEHLRGDTSLAYCLQLLLQYLHKARQQGWPEISVYSFCGGRAPAIRRRVEQAVTDVLEHFIERPKMPYLMEVAESFYVFEQQQQEIKLHIAEDTAQLLELLQRPQQQFIHYYFDRTALQGSPLRLIYQENKAGEWQVFYWLYESRIYFYFLDEHGVLLHQRWDITENNQQLLQWLLPVLGFLRELDQRWQSRAAKESSRTIRLYEIKRKAKSYDFELVKKRLPSEQTTSASIDLKAIVDSQQQVTLYCNGEEFTSTEYQDRLYHTVAKKIQQLRQNTGDYPVFLTDLELPDNQNVIEHLQLRLRLQRRFS